MNRSDAISRLQRGAGFLTGQTDTIISCLQEAQRLLENGRTLPVFLIQEDQTLAVASGTGETALPTGFIREVDNEELRYVPSGATVPRFLEKTNLKNAVKTFAGDDAGAPRAYVLRNSGLLIYPERDQAYSLTWSYYKHSVSLADEVSTNEWLQDENGGPEALIGKAGMILAADLKDEISYKKFAAMYAEGWAGVFAEVILREETNQPIAVGGRL